MITNRSTNTDAPSSERSEEKQDTVVAFHNAVLDMMAHPAFQDQARLLSDMAEATARAHEEVLALKQDLNRAKQLAMQDFEVALEALRGKNSEIQHHAIAMQQAYEPLRQERDILLRERDSLFTEVKQLRKRSRKVNGQRTTFLKKIFWRISVATRALSRNARRNA